MYGLSETLQSRSGNRGKPDPCGVQWHAMQKRQPTRLLHRREAGSRTCPGHTRIKVNTRDSLLALDIVHCY